MGKWAKDGQGRGTTMQSRVVYSWEAGQGRAITVTLKLLNFGKSAGVSRPRAPSPLSSRAYPEGFNPRACARNTGNRKRVS